MRSRRLLLFATFTVLPLLLWASLPLVSTGAPVASKAAHLEKQIQAKQAVIAKKRGHERVLSSDIAHFSTRINALQGDISGLQQRENVIQADLDAKRAELIRLQDSLRSARARLARLRARLARSRVVLAARLTEMYKAQPPDVVTVILSAHGFAELLEQGEFLKRINRQDRTIITAVRSNKQATAKAAKHLAVLETRQQKVAAAVLARRNQVAGVKQQLVDKQSGYASVRSAKASALALTRQSRQAAQEDVNALQAEQSKIEATIRAQQGGGGGTAASPGGPFRPGSGQLSWPVNAPITSPFCERRSYEACHPGIDLGAPYGTPIHAADSGRVTIAGMTGGYGNYTCIQHTATLSTCYGHQSSIQVSVGQNVTKGQVIGLVGSTGHSTGPHLHFEARVNGSVVDPMNYL